MERVQFNGLEGEIISRDYDKEFGWMYGIQFFNSSVHESFLKTTHD